jgi:hypothetical protein
VPLARFFFARFARAGVGAVRLSFFVAPLKLYLHVKEEVVE